MTEQTLISSVDLSQDELAFIMTLFSLSEIGGFAVPATFDDARAVAAGDSLIARGLTSFDANTPAVAADVVRLVTAGASYSAALGVSQQPNGVIERFWCYHQPDQIVLHNRAMPNVEHFELIENLIALSAKLTTLINATTLGTPDGAACFIPKTTLARTEQTRALNGARAAQDALRELGYPDSFAMNVLDETRQIVVVAIRLEELDGHFQAETRTTMLIRAVQGYWLLEEDAVNPDQLSAQPIDANAAIRHLIESIQL